MEIAIRTKDPAMVERNLVHASLSVAPVRIGPLSNPETAYANPGGSPFLLSVRTMETKIEQLIARVEALRKQIIVLRSLLYIAVGILDIFPATFLKSMILTNIGNPSAIKVGNEEAHGGDIVIDVCLLRNGLITYPDTFRRFYRLHWEEAKSLLSMLISLCLPKPGLLLTEGTDSLSTYAVFPSVLSALWGDYRLRG